MVNCSHYNFYFIVPKKPQIKGRTWKRWNILKFSEPSSEALRWTLLKAALSLICVISECKQFLKHRKTVLSHRLLSIKSIIHRKIFEAIFLRIPFKLIIKNYHLEPFPFTLQVQKIPLLDVKHPFCTWKMYYVRLVN